MSLVFEEPGRPIPFNALAHLDPDTIQFALRLREPPSGWLNTDDDDWLAKLSPEERAILEEENKKKKAEAKVKPCTTKACKQVEAMLASNILERASIMSNMNKIDAEVVEALEEYNHLLEIVHTNDVEIDALTATLEALHHKEKHELKERLVAANREKTALENKIFKGEAELRALNNAAAEEEAASNAHGKGAGGGGGGGGVGTA